MSRITTPPSSPERPTPPPEFPYGWRFVRRTLPDGSTDLEQVPLTLEDVLHPQEEDVIPQRPFHEADCRYLTAVLRSRALGPPVVRVVSDLLINWGVSGLRNHAPDVAVFVGLREKPNLHEGTFHLAASGGRCLLVIEVVEPDRRDNDAVHKVKEYYQAGVPHYVLIDQEHEGGPRQLVSYRRESEKYELEALDAEGRLRLPEVGLLLGLREGRLICWNLRTGKELSDPALLYGELEKANRTIQEQAQALEEAKLACREALEQARQAEERARLAAERARQTRAHIQQLDDLHRNVQGTVPGDNEGQGVP